MLKIFIWLVKVMLPLDISVLFTFAKMAPPRNAAKLLWKVLIPVKLNKLLSYAQIAPSLFAELLMKLLIPFKISVTLHYTNIAPPLYAAELLIKSLVSMNINQTFVHGLHHHRSPLSC